MEKADENYFIITYLEPQLLSKYLLEKNLGALKTETKIRDPRYLTNNLVD